MKFAVVMLTRKCNMSCAHCSVASHPGIAEEPSPETLRRTVMELGEAGVRAIQFTGGEPLIRHEVLFELMELAHSRYGIASAIVSNGFWGKKPDRAETFFRRMRQLGLARLTISYDRFHAKFMGPQPVRNILEVARRDFWPVSINITRTKDDSELGELLAPFTEYKNAAFRFYDVQPVGQAIQLEDELRAQLDGFCSGCEQATVTDNGRMLACNGPSYFESNDSALVLGHTSETSLKEMLTFHDEDPILQTIRLTGPLQLKKMLEADPEFQDFPFRKHYSGVCQLCRDICGNTRAVHALREKLAAPEQVALRMAQTQVKCRSREEVWHREAINSFEARRVFFLALSRDAKKKQKEIDQILSRADVDWYHNAEMLAQNGVMARLHARKELIGPRAPNFFWNLVEETEPAPLYDVTLSGLLEEWRRSDFENILQLAVALEDCPELLEQLGADSSPTAKLAYGLLNQNGLVTETTVKDKPMGVFSRLREQLGQAILTQQPYQHFNLFIKPALHLLCTDTMRQLPMHAQLAARAFHSSLNFCVQVRGWKESLALLAKDLAKSKTLIGLKKVG